MVFEMTAQRSYFEHLASPKIIHSDNLFDYRTLLCDNQPGSDGKNYATALSTDGYLVFYADSGEELWRNTAKFGPRPTIRERPGQRESHRRYVQVALRRSAPLSDAKWRDYRTAKRRFLRDGGTTAPLEICFDLLFMERFIARGTLDNETEPELSC